MGREGIRGVEWKRPGVTSKCEKQWPGVSTEPACFFDGAFNNVF